jgi:hypothetical protein
MLAKIIVGNCERNSLHARTKDRRDDSVSNQCERYKVSCVCTGSRCPTMKCDRNSVSRKMRGIS